MSKVRSVRAASPAVARAGLAAAGSRVGARVGRPIPKPGIAALPQACSGLVASVAARLRGRQVGRDLGVAAAWIEAAVHRVRAIGVGELVERQDHAHDRDRIADRETRLSVVATAAAQPEWRRRRRGHQAARRAGEPSEPSRAWPAGMDREQVGDLGRPVLLGDLGRRSRAQVEADRFLAEHAAPGIELVGDVEDGPAGKDADRPAGIADPEADRPLVVEDPRLGPLALLHHAGPVVDAGF